MDRRDFLRAGLAGAAQLALPRRAPAVIPSDRLRPAVEQGVASGDPSLDGVVVWSRADQPARMHVEWALDAAFKGAHRVAPVDALEATDFTARVALPQPPAGQALHYRVRFESLQSPGSFSIPQLGRLRTPARRPHDPLRFCWSGDTAGQGFGINPDIGGMRIYETMRRMGPDLFIHCGDVIYADNPIRPVRHLGDGRVWRNLVSPGTHKVAETIEEFRANFRYNLLDGNLRRFQAEVPQIWQWDDHETKNNWWPGRQLSDRRYRVKSCDLLAARARRAFFEYAPIARRQDAPGRIYRRLPQGPLLEVFVLDARTFRGPNTRNRQRRLGPESAFFGPAQLHWLADALASSTATWKLVASDQPLSLLISHGKSAFEGVGQGSLAARGRELEVAHLLATLKRRQVRNVVWVTADVHYAAAHHYDPARAHFRDFEPFWEFVAGPLNAGTFGPNTLDPTFGPELRFCSAPRGQPLGLSPLDGKQYFGVGTVDPATRGLRVSLHDLVGEELYAVSIDAR